LLRAALGDRPPAAAGRAIDGQGGGPHGWGCACKKCRRDLWNLNRPCKAQKLVQLETSSLAELKKKVLEDRVRCCQPSRADFDVYSASDTGGQFGSRLCGQCAAGLNPCARFFYFLRMSDFYE
jgi:hypothetical protein